MKQLILEKIIVSGFPPVNKRCLWLKGNTFYFWYNGAWRSVDSEIDINDEYIDDKVSETVSKELTAVLGNAPEELDTLGEVADYIARHTEEANTMKDNIDDNAEAIEDLKKKVDEGGGGGGFSDWTEVS